VLVVAPEKMPLDKMPPTLEFVFLLLMLFQLVALGFRALLPVDLKTETEETSIWQWVQYWKNS